MKMRHRRCLIAVCAAVFLARVGTEVRADLFTTLTPTVVQQSANAYLFTYSILNASNSTVGVAELDIDVKPLSNLTSISAPTGFLNFYTAGDPDISFLATDPSVDIAPGARGVFSFVSAVNLGPVPYLMRGFDNQGRVFQNASVANAIVPEPSPLVLAAVCGGGFLGFQVWRRRRPSRSAPALS